MTTTQIKTLPLGLKRFKVFEKETGWNREIIATSNDKAIDKAWAQFWAKLPFTHCNKASLESREI